MDQKAVFISYSSKDRAVAVRLAEDLQKRGYKVWLDVWNIKGHHPFWDEIQQGIEGAGNFVFIISSHSLDKDCAALLELYHAAGLKPTPLILPVLAEKVPFDNLPILLSPGYRQIHDFTQSYEEGLSRLLAALTPDESSDKTRPPLGKLPTPPPKTIPQERRLEAAMPRHTQQAAKSELRVKITLPASAGLKGELPDLTAEGDLINKEDVRHSTFPIAFPVDPATGEAMAITGCLEISSSEFRAVLRPSQGSPCDESMLDVEIPPQQDTRTVVFELIPLEGVRPGRARVTVRLYYLGRIVAETAVATQIIAEAVSAPAWNFGVAQLAFAGIPANVLPLVVPPSRQAPGAPPKPTPQEEWFGGVEPEPEEMFDELETIPLEEDKEAETEPAPPVPHDGLPSRAIAEVEEDEIETKPASPPPPPPYQVLDDLLAPPQPAEEQAKQDTKPAPPASRAESPDGTSAADRLREAKRLLETRDYEAARMLLETLPDRDKAQKWLARDPDQQSWYDGAPRAMPSPPAQVMPKRSRSALLYALPVLGVIVAILCVGLVFLPNEGGQQSNATDTPEPTPTTTTTIPTSPSPTTYTTRDNALTVTYPADWQVQDRQGQVILTLPDGSTLLVTPAPAAELGLDANGTVQQALDFFIQNFTTGAADFEPQPQTTINEQPALYMTNPSEAERRILMVMQTPAGDFIFLAGTSSTLPLEDLTQLTFDLAESATYHPPVE